MLQIRDLTVTMKKDLRDLLRGFTFALNPGDKAAIIGEEGNGKSTLLKLLYDPALVEGYVEYTGAIQKDGMLLGYLSQEVPPEQGELSAYEFCCQSPAFLDASPGELAAAAKRLRFPLDWFYSDRLVKTFSGGEKVKLRMALLTLGRPDCYLLDEPSNDLDIDTLDWLETFIRECAEPVLFISHDELLLERTANVILHMEQLRAQDPAPLDRGPHGLPPVRGGAAAKVHPPGAAGPQGAGGGAQTAGTLPENPAKGGTPAEHHLPPRPPREPAAEKENEGGQVPGAPLRTGAGGHDGVPRQRGGHLGGLWGEHGHPRGENRAGLHLARPVRRGSLPGAAAPGGEPAAVRPGRGARVRHRPQRRGKTTFLRQVAGELLGRQDIRAAYMPQDYGETVDQSQTPVEFLAKSWEKEELTRVKTYLGSMKYTPEEQEHTIQELSGGQKAKLFFLKMILDGSNVLVLDEPTRNFSPLSGPVIRGILEEFPGCILSVSHDRKYIGQVCDTVYQLEPQGLVPVENQWR